MYDNLKIDEGVENMKDIVFDYQFGKRNEKYGCDSFDENTWIGKYIKSSVDLGLFKNPGDAPFKVIKKGSAIPVGYITGFNSGKKWAKISSKLHGDAWIIFKPENLSIVGYVGEATQKQLEDAKKSGADAAKGFLKDNSPIAYIGTKTADTAINVSKGVVNTADTVLSLGSFIGSNLKIIFIVAIVAVAAYVLLSLKSKL